MTTIRERTETWAREYMADEVHDAALLAELNAKLPALQDAICDLLVELRGSNVASKERLRVIAAMQAVSRVNNDAMSAGQLGEVLPEPQELSAGLGLLTREAIAQAS